MGIFEGKYHRKIAAQYPKYAEGWEIVGVGNSIEELKSGINEIIETVNELEFDGQPLESAMQNAIEQAKHLTHAPEEYVFVHLKDPATNMTVLLTLKK